MFEIVNLYNKNLITVIIQHKNRKVEFVIGSIISRRSKEDLDPEKQFKLLNSYLDFKGEKFKDDLFKKYVYAEEEIMTNIIMKDIHPLPKYLTHPIIDMFDMLDVFNYIKNVYGIEAPKNLMDTFDPNIEADGRGSRVQTYLKDDYFELAALSVILKCTLPILGQFAYVKNKDINGIHKEYILFNMITTHRIMESPPMVKLHGWIDKLLEMPGNSDPDSASIRIIEKNIPKSEITDFILAIVVIQKVCIATIVDDDIDRNIVTKSYNYINNKLKTNGDVTKTIRNKTALMDQDGGIGEKESMVESFRITSDLSPGSEEELDWSVSDMNNINNGSLRPVDLDKALTIKKILISIDFDPFEGQVELLGFLFKDVIDPRGIDYITIDSLYNLYAIGFWMLWDLEYKKLAMLLLAKKDHNETNTLIISTNVNKNRMSKEIKDTLQELFPYNRVINATTSVNIVEEQINELANDFFAYRWITVLPKEYITEAVGSNDNSLLLPTDLKIRLAEMFIGIEKLRK